MHRCLDRSWLLGWSRPPPLTSVPQRRRPACRARDSRRLVRKGTAERRGTAATALGYGLGVRSAANVLADDARHRSSSPCGAATPVHQALSGAGTRRDPRPGLRAGHIAGMSGIIRWGGTLAQCPASRRQSLLIVLDSDVWFCPKVICKVTLLAASVCQPQSSSNVCSMTSVSAGWM